MIRVCPERDTVCPHGLSCPYTKDRYECDRLAVCVYGKAWEQYYRKANLLIAGQRAMGGNLS